MPIYKKIFTLLTPVLFLLIAPSIAWGYPIEGFSGSPLDEANKLSQSINETILGLFQGGLFKSFIPGFRFQPTSSIASFNVNLINKENFSGQDIGGILKAVAVLFLQILVTVLGVLLGILKLALELFTRW